MASDVDFDTARLWHRRLMHAGNAAMARLAKCGLIPKLSDFDFSKCDACLQGGGHKIPIGSSHGSSKRRNLDARKHRPFTYFGERIASDLCGPFPMAVVAGAVL